MTLLASWVLLAAAVAGTAAAGRTGVYIGEDGVSKNTQLLAEAGGCGSVDSFLVPPPGDILKAVPILLGTSSQTASTCSWLEVDALAVHVNTSALVGVSGMVAVDLQASSCDDAAAKDALRQLLLASDLLLSDWSRVRAACCKACTPDQLPPPDQLGLTTTNLPVATPTSPGNGWVTLQGYRHASSRPAPLATSYQPDADQCRRACAATAGCASYLYSFKDAAAADRTTACTLLADQTTPGAPLVPCDSSTAPGCTYGYQHQGSCRAMPASGVKLVGVTTAAWETIKASPSPAFNLQGIPSTIQGRSAATVAECNCRCERTSLCVGYLYQQDKACWLATALDLFGSLNVITPVSNPTDDSLAVLGRLVRPPGQLWPACAPPPPAAGAPSFVPSPGQQPLATVSSPSLTDCNSKCGASPPCVGVSWSSSSQECVLLTSGQRAQRAGVTSTSLIRCPTRSELDPPAITSRAPSWLTGTTSSSPHLARMQWSQIQPSNTTAVRSASDCLAVCSSTAGCAAMQYRQSSSACVLGKLYRTAASSTAPASGLSCPDGEPGCVVAYRAPGTCQLIPSGGVQGLGKVWAGWQPGNRTWEDTIEAGSQGLVTQTAAECMCSCLQQSACMGYTFLGGNRTCWLHSVVDFSQPLVPDSSALTVTGKLELPDRYQAVCTSTGMHNHAVYDSTPSGGVTAGILRTPNPFATSSKQACNEACLSDPACVAFTLAARSSCTLFSSVAGLPLVRQQGSLFSHVQRCGPMNPGSMETQRGISDDSSTSSSISLIVGVVCGVLGALLLLGLLTACIILLVCRARRRSAASKDALNTTGIDSQPSQVSQAVHTVEITAMNTPMQVQDSTTAASQQDGSTHKLPTSTAIASPATATGPHVGAVAPPNSASTAALDTPCEIDHCTTTSVGGGGGSVEVVTEEPGSMIEVQTSPEVPGTPNRTTSQAGRQMFASRESDFRQATWSSVPDFQTLLEQEQYLSHLTPHFQWSNELVDSSFKSVEEGITAARLAGQVLLGSRWRLPQDAPGPPPEQLSAARVQQELEVMTQGVIGRGGTSIVFKCKWSKKFGAKGLLAIKLMRHPGALDSFIREAQVLRMKSGHENLVHMYGFCLEQPTVCIVTELLPTNLQRWLYGTDPVRCDFDDSCSSRCINRAQSLYDPSTPALAPLFDSSLRSVLTQANSLPMQAADVKSEPSVAVWTAPLAPSPSLQPSSWDARRFDAAQYGLAHRPDEQPPQVLVMQVVRMAAGVASGLAHLHTLDSAAEGGSAQQAARMVIHRDLSPKNILINSKGRAKITGLGKALLHTKPEVHLADSVTSTLPYVAPELLSPDTSHLTNKVDLFCLGMIMWEVAARVTPFAGERADDVVSKICHGVLPPLPDGPPVDPAVAHNALELRVYNAVVRACWQGNPDMRPKASVVVKELRRLLRHFGVGC